MRTASLRVVSKSVIGLVFVNLHSQGFGFAIGYIYAESQACGMSLRLKHAVINFLRVFFIFSPKCLIISLLIPDGPVALLLGRALICSDHSSSVGSFINEEYMDSSIEDLGIY